VSRIIRKGSPVYPTFTVILWARAVHKGLLIPLFVPFLSNLFCNDKLDFLAQEKPDTKKGLKEQPINLVTQKNRDKSKKYN
jgi:hypothetical protein